MKKIEVLKEVSKGVPGFLLIFGFVVLMIEAENNPPVSDYTRLLLFKVGLIMIILGVVSGVIVAALWGDEQTKN